MFNYGEFKIMCSKQLLTDWHQETLYSHSLALNLDAVTVASFYLAEVNRP